MPEYLTKNNEVLIENKITERCMLLLKDNNSCTIAGGKYTSEKCVFNNKI